MVLVCEKCGGKNTIFGNEGTKYCAFCGNQLDLPKEENKSSTISHSRIGTDLEIILDYLRNGSVGKFVLPLAQLKEVHLKNALLAQANLNGANFEKSVLSGANFQGAILHDTNLSWANLDNVDLTWIFRRILTP